jgi:hypothetical protein
MVAWLVGLINHHFVLKLSKIDISENFKFFCAPPSLKGNWLLSHKVFMRRLSNRRGHFGKDQCFLPQRLKIAKARRARRTPSNGLETAKQ